MLQNYHLYTENKLYCSKRYCGHVADETNTQVPYAVTTDLIDIKQKANQAK